MILSNVNESNCESFCSMVCCYCCWERSVATGSCSLYAICGPLFSWFVIILYSNLHSPLETLFGLTEPFQLVLFSITINITISLFFVSERDHTSPKSSIAPFNALSNQIIKVKSSYSRKTSKWMDLGSLKTFPKSIYLIHKIVDPIATVLSNRWLPSFFLVDHQYFDTTVNNSLWIILAISLTYWFALTCHSLLSTRHRYMGKGTDYRTSYYIRPSTRLNMWKK